MLIIWLCDVYSYSKETTGLNHLMAQLAAQNQLSNIFHSSSASRPTASQEPAAAASFCVSTDSVDLQINNKLNHNIEQLTQRDSSYRNVYNDYDTIDYKLSASSAASPPDLPPRPSAAASEASSSVAADINYLQPSNSDYDLPATSERSSALSSHPAADSGYIHPSDPVGDVPCFYQIQPNSSPSDNGLYANCDWTASGNNNYNVIYYNHSRTLRRTIRTEQQTAMQDSACTIERKEPASTCRPDTGYKTSSRLPQCRNWINTHRNNKRTHN